MITIETKRKLQTVRTRYILIKVITRRLEMDTEKYLSPGEMIQFASDVPLYGLYEAILLADNEELCKRHCPA